MDFFMRNIHRIAYGIILGGFVLGFLMWASMTAGEMPAKNAVKVADIHETVSEDIMDGFGDGSPHKCVQFQYENESEYAIKGVDVCYEMKNDISDEKITEIFGEEFGDVVSVRNSVMNVATGKYLTTVRRGAQSETYPYTINDCYVENMDMYNCYQPYKMEIKFKARGTYIETYNYETGDYKIERCFDDDFLFIFVFVISFLAVTLTAALLRLVFYDE